MLNAREIPLNRIQRKGNYRKSFDKNKLMNLTHSIKSNGVLEPIIVRDLGNGNYQLIAGDRRLKASEIAGKVTIPAVIKHVDEDEVLELQLIENIQREGVNYMEEALALRQLRDQQSLTDKEIGKKISKSETYVTYQLKLTEMPQSAIDACLKGELTKAVAWVIARLPSDEMKIKAADDLRRANSSKLITERSARKYIEETFSETPKKRNRSAAEKIFGNDYRSNWKIHLLSFTAEEFDTFKTKVNGKTEVSVWIDAIEAIKSEVE